MRRLNRFTERVRNATVQLSWFLFLKSLYEHQQASAPRRKTVSVGTFNMYVGFDIEQRAKEFSETGDRIGVARKIISDLQKTRGKLRMKMVARDLIDLAPDFLTLQEVAKIRIPGFYQIDFLKELLEEIKKQSGSRLEYNYITVENMAFEDKIDIGFGIKIPVHFSDREVILYRSEYEIEGEVVSKRLSAHREPFNFGGKPIILHRSLIGARFTRNNERIITLFTTHLEQDYLSEIQRTQMEEIMKIISPFSRDENLVLAGDYNADERDEAYKLAQNRGFIDTFKVSASGQLAHTFCNKWDLSNVEPIEDSKRIDHIFNISSAWKLIESNIIFNKKQPIWPSDHCGVLTHFARV